MMRIIIDFICGIFIWFLFYSRPQMSGLFIASHQNDKSDLFVFSISARSTKEDCFPFQNYFLLSFRPWFFTIFPFAFLFSCFLFSTIDKTIKLWFMATNYISKTEPQRGVLQIDWRHIFISLYSVLCFDDCWF